MFMQNENIFLRNTLHTLVVTPAQCTSTNDNTGGIGSPGCGSNLPTMPMPGKSSLLKIRYNDPNLGKVAVVLTMRMIIMNNVTR